MKRDLGINLLPSYFKKLAYAVILVLIGLVILYKVEILVLSKDVAKQFSETVLLCALLVLAIARDQEEDELTVKIRMKAFAFAFIYGVLTVALEPIFNIFFEGSFMAEMNSFKLLLNMFGAYFIMMLILKRGR